MRPSDAMHINRAVIRRVVATHHASNARVFGSAALGKDTEGSDLDLLIDPSSDCIPSAPVGQFSLIA